MLIAWAKLDCTFGRRIGGLGCRGLASPYPALITGGIDVAAAPAKAEGKYIVSFAMRHVREAIALRSCHCGGRYLFSVFFDYSLTDLYLNFLNNLQIQSSLQ